MKALITLVLLVVFVSTGCQRPVLEDTEGPESDLEAVFDFQSEKVGCKPIHFVPPLYTDTGCRVWCQLPYRVDLNVLTGAATVNCVPLDDSCVMKVYVDPEGYPIFDQGQVVGHHPAIFIKDIPVEEEMEVIPPNGPRFCLDYLSVDYYDESGATLFATSGALWNDGDYIMIRIVPEPSYWDSVKDGRVEIFFTTCFPLHYAGCEAAM